MKTPEIVLLGLGFCLAAPPHFNGQVAIESRKNGTPVEKRSGPTLRVDTSLVLVPVAVTDGLNRPVSGLEKQNFRVFDDKVEQTIATLSMDDEPVAVAFVIDVSGSMAGFLRQTSLAAREFFKAAEDGDEFMLIEFDSSARVTVPLTRNSGEIQNQILFSRARGSTALLDGIYLGVNAIKKSKNARKALIVISDGGENSSRYKESEVKNLLREGDSLIYSIGGGSPGSPLKELSEQTGGRLIGANSQGEFSDLARKIVVDLRNRYVLGYAPTNAKRDGRYHGIDVKIVPPQGFDDLRAHWRRGYYAPTE